MTGLEMELSDPALRDAGVIALGVMALWATVVLLVWIKEVMR